MDHFLMTHLSIIPNAQLAVSTVTGLTSQLDRKIRKEMTPRKYILCEVV